MSTRGALLPGLVVWVLSGLQAPAQAAPRPTAESDRRARPRPRRSPAPRRPVVARRPGPALQGTTPSHVSAAPWDRKERHPQPKVGDHGRVDRRHLEVGVVAPHASRRIRRRKKKTPLSLETDPVDFPPLLLSRDRYVFPASPRLRTGFWLASWGTYGSKRRYRVNEPEMVYERRLLYLEGRAGVAVKFGRMEASLDLPFVGFAQIDFYQLGAVDRQIRKVDFPSFGIGLKYSHRFKWGRHVLLVAPYLSISPPLPWTQRKEYEVSIGGQRITGHSAGVQNNTVLPGVAVGYRWGMISAIASLSVASLLPRKQDKFLAEGLHKKLLVDFVGAYQLAFIPVRDVAVTAGVYHRHRLHPAEEVVGLELEDDDTPHLVHFMASVRIHPYSGFIGHIGFSVPLNKSARAIDNFQAVIQVGWELN